MTDVLQKLLCADVVIWSFPLYYFSLPSRLKTVIDRQLPLTPFAFLKYKPTIFEYITVFAVSAVSLLSVLGYLTDPASYLAFGLIWTNRILTAVMCVFTVWFEKWYPRHYAADGGR